jgi:hypothetical protein
MRWPCVGKLHDLSGGRKTVQKSDRQMQQDRRTNRRSNQYVHGCLCMEFKEMDGKTGRKFFIPIFPTAFPC